MTVYSAFPALMNLQVTANAPSLTWKASLTCLCSVAASSSCLVPTTSLLHHCYHL